MSDLTKISKKMSYLLRHSDKLSMSSDGYVAIDDLLSELNVSKSILHRVVDTNNKSRFEISGDRIRACQGHSRRLATIQDTWTAEPTSGRKYYHATREEYLTSIMEQGLLRGSRTHVHLAASKTSNVGKRSGVDVLLEINGNILAEKNINAFRSTNGVILVSHVPPEALVRV
jgi:putative RNA 2'-phosphotransferase